jgi:hypothetical protein
MDIAAEFAKTLFDDENRKKIEDVRTIKPHTKEGF